MEVLIIVLFGFLAGLGIYSLKSLQEMIMPLRGLITSPFGPRAHPITGINTFHNGIDIKADTGTPIKAPYSGKVSSIYTHASGGKSLILDQSNGFRSGFAHLSGYAVSLGQTVKKGEIIGYVGATGAVTGPHLHFTLTDPEKNYVDPLKYLI